MKTTKQGVVLVCNWAEGVFRLVFGHKEVTFEVSPE